MKKIILFLLLTNFLYSCKEENINHPLKFNKNYKVKGERIFSDNLEVFNVYVINNFLLTKNTNLGKNVFSLYDSKTLKYIGGFGKLGEGPEEFHNLTEYSNQFINENNEIKIWIYERVKGKLSKINLTKSIENSKTVFEKVVDINPSVFYERTVYYFDEQKIIGQVSNLDLKMSQIRFYNPVKNKVFKEIPFANLVKNENKNIGFIQNQYNAIYLNSLGIKPDKSKIVSGMYEQNRLDIFDANGELVNSIIEGEHKPIQNFEEYLKSGKATIYYSYLNLTDKYIFALYNNQLKSEYWANPIPIEIRIFDWNGQPIANIEIPDYLTFFTININLGILYGVSLPDEKIIKYNIKSILNEL